VTAVNQRQEHGLGETDDVMLRCVVGSWNERLSVLTNRHWTLDEDLFDPSNSDQDKIAQSV